MTITQPLVRNIVDWSADLTLELGREEAAAHSDLPMNPPDRELNAFFPKSEMPGTNMVVDAIDKSAVEIEEECDRRSHRSVLTRVALFGPTPIKKCSGGLKPNRISTIAVQGRVHVGSIAWKASEEF